MRPLRRHAAWTADVSVQDGGGAVASGQMFSGGFMFRTLVLAAASVLIGAAPCSNRHGRSESAHGRIG